MKHRSVFEAITIALACNKILRKRFLNPDTIGLIPKGGHTSNKKYIKKAVMWLMYTEQTYGVKIKHGRNGRECRLPELPNFSVDGYCPQTNTIYEFSDCFWHGNTCQPVGDVSTMNGVNLPEGYEHTVKFRADSAIGISSQDSVGM